MASLIGGIVHMLCLSMLIDSLLHMEMVGLILKQDAFTISLQIPPFLFSSSYPS